MKMVCNLQLTRIGAKFMFVAGMFVSGCVTILFGWVIFVGWFRCICLLIIFTHMERWPQNRTGNSWASFGCWLRHLTFCIFTFYLSLAKQNERFSHLVVSEPV